jgi:hypothetical protein
VVGSGPFVGTVPPTRGGAGRGIPERDDLVRLRAARTGTVGATAALVGGGTVPGIVPPTCGGAGRGIRELDNLVCLRAGGTGTVEAVVGGGTFLGAVPRRTRSGAGRRGAAGTDTVGTAVGSGTLPGTALPTCGVTRRGILELKDLVCLAFFFPLGMSGAGTASCEILWVSWEADSWKCLLRLGSSDMGVILCLLCEVAGADELSSSKGSMTTGA